MIMGYALAAEGRLRPIADVAVEKDAALWVDLLRPSPEEERMLESALRIEVPTREEMSEIEVSSRLYADEDGLFMTALILSHTDEDDARISPVTFVLTGARLLTIRYEEPRVFRLFAARAQKAQTGCVSAETVLVGLLEAIVDRLADILERAVHDADRLSADIFAAREAKAPPRDFQKLIMLLGRKNDLASMVRDSIVSLDRLFGFLSLHVGQKGESKELRARIKTLSRDAASLADHVSFLSQKITFLLDATLGMINIQQNNIIKLFSVAAVAFLPPTLVASIYGMNFHHMPELDWRFGYPLAIGVMLLSAAVPMWYFRRKGWF